MRHSKVIDLVVGVFVFCGVIAALFLATKVGDFERNKKESYTLYAAFNNIGDLKVKSPVTLAGVRIGRVVKISIDKEYYEAIVEVEIDGDYDNIPTDSSLSILTAGLLGSKYLGLDPGAEEDYMMEGDRFEITQSAIVLENLIGSFLSSGAGSN